MTDLALWCRTFLSYLDPLSDGGAYWISLKSSVLRSCELGSSKAPLKACQLELRQMGRELPAPLRQELDQLLIQTTGEGLGSTNFEQRRRILKNGRIKNEAEYEIMRMHMDELEAQGNAAEQLANVQGMLDSYGPKSPTVSTTQRPAGPKK